MYTIRKANTGDLGFITKIDLDDEGIATGNPAAHQSTASLGEHRRKMKKFILKSSNTAGTEYDTCPKHALICIEKETKKRIGLIMFLFRDINSPTFQPFGIFDKYDRSIFPSDGRFCEIFQLWVAPEHRRQGIATALKKKAEVVSGKNNISMIYTHTEAANEHVIEMNKRLGYKIIRKGTLWDDIVRVSLIKNLKIKKENS